MQPEKQKSNFCIRHPRRVYFDGKLCPCCTMLRELKHKTRKKVFKQGRLLRFDLDKFWVN